MAENKQYINQDIDNGSVLISEDVIATIVARAVSEVDDVSGLSNNSIMNRSIRIVISQNNELTIDCNIIVIYGCSVFDVAKSVQIAIGNAVQAMTGITAKTINVNVTGIVRK